MYDVKIIKIGKVGCIVNDQICMMHLLLCFLLANKQKPDNLVHELVMHPGMEVTEIN